MLLLLLETVTKCRVRDRLAIYGTIGGTRTPTPRGRRTGLFLMERRRGQVRSTGEREAGPAAQHFITGSFICVCLQAPLSRSNGTGRHGIGVCPPMAGRRTRQRHALAISAKADEWWPMRGDSPTKPTPHSPTAHADGQTEDGAESNTGPSPYRPCPNSAPPESIRRTDTTASIPTGLMRSVAEIQSGNGCKSGARSTMSPGPRDRRNGMGE